MREKFGEIKEQSWIARHSIDCYVPAIDVYVQLDGVYWHGLTGDEAITSKIEKTIKRDADLNYWFVKSNKKLFRITDLQWNDLVDEEDFETLRLALINCVPGVTFFDGTIGYFDNT